ncbi:MAG: glycoside hydrolase, partial [Actinobacteria bacterium]|nr:glycoside hydrolase [Actinomycetota bacterium]
AVAGPGGRPVGELSYRLAAGGHAAWDLTVRAQPGAAAGRRFLAARITDALGQSLEDAAVVTVGEPGAPGLDLPLPDLLPLIEAGTRAAAAEIEASLSPAVLAVPPGGRAEIGVRIVNRTASAIRGESQLISPFGTWEAAGPPALGFTAAAGEAAVLRYPLAVPAGARPGSHWWALAKLMYFGRVHYTGCAAVTVTG